MYFWDDSDATSAWVEIDVAALDGLQLHENDKIHVIMTIHLIQDNDLQDLFGDFDVDIEVIQWNEYGV